MCEINTQKKDDERLISPPNKFIPIIYFLYRLLCFFSCLSSLTLIIHSSRWLLRLNDLSGLQANFNSFTNLHTARIFKNSSALVALSLLRAPSNQWKISFVDYSNWISRAIHSMSRPSQRRRLATSSQSASVKLLFSLFSLEIKPKWWGK